MNFTCHNCGFTKDVSNKYAGKKVRCPKCSELVLCNQVVGKNRFEEIEIRKASGGQRIQKSNSNESSLPSLAEYIKKYEMNTQLDELEGKQIIELYTHEGVRIFNGDIISKEGEIKEAESQFFIGRGKFILSMKGQMISQVELNNDSLYISESAIIACDSSLNIEEKKTKNNFERRVYKLSGKGVVTFASYGKPKVISNTGQAIANSKFESTILWTSGLKYQLNSNMTFQGDGFVLTQPYLIKINKNKMITSQNDSKQPMYKIISVVASVLLVVMSYLYFDAIQGTSQKASRSIASTQTANELLVERINKKKFELKGQKSRLRRMGLKATENDRKNIKDLEFEIEQLEQKL